MPLRRTSAIVMEQLMLFVKFLVILVVRERKSRMLQKRSGRRWASTYVAVKRVWLLKTHHCVCVCGMKEEMDGVGRVGNSECRHSGTPTPNFDFGPKYVGIVSLVSLLRVNPMHEFNVYSMIMYRPSAS